MRTGPTHAAVLQALSDTSFEESSTAFSASSYTGLSFRPVTVLLRQAFFETCQAH
jgi:hypothetical protein